MFFQICPAQTIGFSIELQVLPRLKISNANTTYLPGISAYGKAWYQSDAISVMGQNGPVIEVDQFQYNGGIEALQTLYDGGLTSRKKNLEKASLNAELGKIETDLYQLNSLVTDLFFSAILLDKSREIIQLKTQLLHKRLEEMESAFNSGIVKQNDLEKFRTELLLTQQKMLEIEKQRQQVIISLQIYTGIEINPETTFISTEDSFHSSKTNRPEYSYFDAEIQRLESMARLQKSRNLPFLVAYGQAGYSYPGLNFYENEPDYYYIVGLKLSWTLFDWKQNKRETQVILKQREIIQTNRTDFDQKISIALSQKLIEQQKLVALIEIDNQLIDQLSAISKGSEAALLNGVITSTDYLEDMNAEIKARLDRESHKTELQKTTLQYQLMEGIDTSIFTQN